MSSDRREQLTCDLLALAETELAERPVEVQPFPQLVENEVLAEGLVCALNLDEVRVQLFDERQIERLELIDELRVLSELGEIVRCESGVDRGNPGALGFSGRKGHHFE